MTTKTVSLDTGWIQKNDNKIHTLTKSPTDDIFKVS